MKKKVRKKVKVRRQEPEVQAPPKKVKKKVRKVKPQPVATVPKTKPKVTQTKQKGERPTESPDSYPRVRLKPLPFQMAHLRPYMVRLVGYRQSLFSLLQQLGDHQSVEATERRQRVFEIHMELFHQVCDAESKLAKFALDVDSNFLLPHGTGFHELPVTQAFNSSNSNDLGKE